MNLRPLGYERGETDPDVRRWTRLDGQTCRSQRCGVRQRPPASGSVRRSLPTFCLHAQPSSPACESKLVLLNVVVHLCELGSPSLGSALYDFDAHLAHCHGRECLLRKGSGIALPTFCLHDPGDRRVSI